MFLKGDIMYTRVSAILYFFRIRKSRKWVNIYRIVLGYPRHVQIDTKFIVIDILHWVKYWVLYCVIAILAAILDFSKCSIVQFLHYSDLQSTDLKDSESTKNNRADSIFRSSPTTGFFLQTIQWKLDSPKADVKVAQREHQTSSDTPITDWMWNMCIRDKNKPAPTSQNAHIKRIR